MRPSPYRQPITPPQAELHEDPLSSTDFDLVPVFGLLWIVSIFQFAISFRCDRALAPTDGLAGVAIVVLPLLVREPLRVLVARLSRLLCTVIGRACVARIRKS